MGCIEHIKEKLYGVSDYLWECVSAYQQYSYNRNIEKWEKEKLDKRRKQREKWNNGHKKT